MNFSLQLEHENTKTLYFATDSTSDLENWVSLLRQEAMMKGQKGQVLLTVCGINAGDNLTMFNSINISSTSNISLSHM